jgi:hypothetical protein
MTDRDTFAAAALTGLLADQSLGDLGDITLATRAYELASAMTEERDRISVYTQPTLTDEERKAVKTAVGAMGIWMADNNVMEDESMRRAVLTLRSLLERTK